MWHDATGLIKIKWQSRQNGSVPENPIRSNRPMEITCTVLIVGPYLLHGFSFRAQKENKTGRVQIAMGIHSLTTGDRTGPPLAYSWTNIFDHKQTEPLV